MFAAGAGWDDLHETVNPVAVVVKIIEAEMKISKRCYEAEDCQSNCKADDVEKSVAFVSKQVSVSGFEVAKKHG